MKQLFTGGIFVNGIFCEDIKAAAKIASIAAGMKVSPNMIHKALEGKAAELADVADIREAVEVGTREEKPKYAGVLLRYPKGETPIDRGLPPART